MDAKQENSRHDNGRAKEVKDVESIGHDDDHGHQIRVRIKDENKSLNTSSPKQETPKIVKEEVLECTKAEVGEVKEENQRLKKMLKRIENDYRSLQTRFFDIIQHEQSSNNLADTSLINEGKKKEDEPEISLCLGFQTPTKPKSDDNKKSSIICGEGRDDVQLMSEGLSLGLELKSPSKTDGSDQIRSDRSNEVEDGKEDDGIEETWPPSKVLKTKKSNNVKEEESLQQNNNNKRARVSVRARCDTPTMNDGCQWRKYGQKIAKGNPCPRAYYRCTVGPSCPVRKQVQRCSEDMSILITTYEGTHNHPLPVSATAMASTTSAAASILMSGSSTSETHNSSTPTTTTAASINGLNFTLYTNPRTGQLNLPGSPSTSPPTITLDLTTSPFNRRSNSNNFLSSPKYPSRSLDFSSSSSDTNSFPLAWSNTYLNNYTSFSFGKSTQQFASSSYSSSSSSSSSSSQHILTETLTKILTSDPSFQSAVAAAISSMVGSGNNNNNNNNTNTKFVGAESVVSSMRWGGQVQTQGISINPLAHVNRIPSSWSSSPSNSQAPGSFMLVQNSFPFSLSKSSSTPDLRDQLK